jgi:integrase
VPEPDARRLPFREEDLSRLREETAKGAHSFVALRRQTTFTLLDNTGVRRMEACMLSVGQVKDAIRMMDAALSEENITGANGQNLFYLKIHTVKHGRERIVPIDPIVLQSFSSYLKFRRRYLTEMGLYTPSPDAPFLVSATTGKALTPDAITTEMNLLGKAAGIATPCSPHLLRHRYILRLFIRLLLSHKMENADDFQLALLSDNAFKEKVREFTGHADIASLDYYLNLAFDEIAQLEKTMSRVQIQTHIDSLLKLSEQLVYETRNGKSFEIAFRELTDSVKTFQYA